MSGRHTRPPEFVNLDHSLVLEQMLTGNNLSRCGPARFFEVGLKGSTHFQNVTLSLALTLKPPSACSLFDQGISFSCKTDPDVELVLFSVQQHLIILQEVGPILATAW